MPPLGRNWMWVALLASSVLLLVNFLVASRGIPAVGVTCPPRCPLSSGMLSGASDSVGAVVRYVSLHGTLDLISQPSLVRHLELHREAVLLPTRQPSHDIDELLLAIYARTCAGVSINDLIHAGTLEPDRIRDRRARALVYGLSAIERMERGRMTHSLPEELDGDFLRASTSRINHALELDPESPYLNVLRSVVWVTEYRRAHDRGEPFRSTHAFLDSAEIGNVNAIRAILGSQTRAGRIGAPRDTGRIDFGRAAGHSEGVLLMALNNLLDLENRRMLFSERCKYAPTDSGLCALVGTLVGVRSRYCVALAPNPLSLTGLLTALEHEAICPDCNRTEKQKLQLLNTLLDEGRQIGGDEWEQLRTYLPRSPYLGRSRLLGNPEAEKVLRLHGVRL